MPLRHVYATALALTVLLLTSGCKAMATRPMEPPRYTITGPDGGVVNREDLLDEAVQADVVLVGETHDNPAAHHLAHALFKGILQRRSEGETPPRVALSLEMLARDLQPVTDEYLQGLITETHFMAASRPWANYGPSYRQTVNLAREKGAPVVAANAPRRYVNLVARKGKEALGQLSPQARDWIAPLPYGGASPAYRAKIEALETRLAAAKSPHGLENETSPGIDPDAQALWDATMAWSIAEARQKHPGHLVMHIAGAFHCEGGLGIPEHLALYDPSARILIITVRPPRKGEPLPLFRSDLSVREYTVQTQ